MLRSGVREKNVKDIMVELPEDIKNILIDRKSVKKATREAKKEQKVVSGVEVNTSGFNLCI